MARRVGVGEVTFDRIRQSLHPVPVDDFPENRVRRLRPTGSRAPRPRVRHPEHRLHQGRRHLGAPAVRGGDRPAPHVRELRRRQRGEREVRDLRTSKSDPRDGLGIERFTLARVHDRRVPVPSEHRVARGREQLGIFSVHASRVVRPRSGVGEEEKLGEEVAVGIYDVVGDARGCGPRFGIHAVSRSPFVADTGPRELQVAARAPGCLVREWGRGSGRGQR